jgi:hypothetical protein
MKNVFKSKLSFVVTGLLIVAVVAVPLIMNSVRFRQVHAEKAASADEDDIEVNEYEPYLFNSYPFLTEM